MKIEIRRELVNFTRYLLGSLYMLMGKPLLKRELTTFVFHEISDNPRAHARETRTYSDTKTFERQIEWIQKSFEVQDLRTDETDLSKGGCLVTFDDGYEGVLGNALPILRSNGVPAVCFLNMATIHGEINSSAMAMYAARREGRPVNWADSNPSFYSHVAEKLNEEELNVLRDYQGPYLNEKQLEKLADDPLITIGDHLNNHWLLDVLTSEEINKELAKGSKELQNFRSYMHVFAAPHGVSQSVALECLSSSGFCTVFSGNEIRRIGTLTIYPRIDLNNEIASIQHFFGAILVSKIRIWAQRSYFTKN